MAEPISGVWKLLVRCFQHLLRIDERGPDIASPNGTGIGEGQLFEYNPKSETLRIIYVSPARSALENPDNIVVAPDGSIIFCEDNADGTGGVGANEGERLVWLYPKSRRDLHLRAEQHGFHRSRIGDIGTALRPDLQH